MRKALSCMLLVLLVFCLPLSGLAEEVVNVYNWEDYIDPAVLDQFTQETGITVNMQIGCCFQCIVFDPNAVPLFVQFESISAYIR